MPKSPEELAEDVIEAMGQVMAYRSQRPFQNDTAWADCRKRHQEKCVAALVAFGRGCAAQSKEANGD